MANPAVINGQIGERNTSSISVALLAAFAYYCGALIGFELTFEPLPISVLWPPNSILLGALLITPPACWWVIILSAFPAHLAAEMQSGVPLEMILGWFASNCSEALIGAVCVRRVAGERLRFDSFRHVSIFLFYAAFLAPFLSSFLDAALVRFIGWGQGSYWQLWRLRFFSNVLAVLAFVPVILTWGPDVLASIRDATFVRRAEVGIWVLALLTAGSAVFIAEYQGDSMAYVLHYALLPIVFWAVLQFRPFMVSLSFLTITLLVVWAAGHGHGPFVADLPASRTLHIQLFLIGIAVPLFLLSSAVQERRRTQAALRQKDEKLHLAMEAAKVGTWDWDIRENKCVWSPESTRIFGCGDGDNDITLESFSNLLHPEDRAAVIQAIERVATKGGSYEAEFRIVRPDGEIRWVAGKGAALLDEKNSPVRMLGVNVDVTDRKLAETAGQREAVLREMGEELERRVADRTGELRRAIMILREEIEQRHKAEKAEWISKERFFRVFRFNPNAMLITCGADGKILDANARWEGLFGYRRDEVVGHTVCELNLYASEADFRMVCEQSSTLGYIRDREIEMRTKDGEIRQTIFSGEAIDGGDEPCFITTIRDVTAQRRAEMEAQKQHAQLTHLTRVALLGELSGALAHELNQPLTAILTNAQAAQRFLSRDDCELDEIREILEDIVVENKRAGKVIRRLRTLFMKGDPKLQPLDLSELVSEALDLAHSDLIARNVSVAVNLKPNLGPVRGDRVQLQQVLLNLIINACESMSGNAPDKRELAFLGGAEADRDVWIAISDTGPGIPADAFDHVFDSFFTTKAHGLGLGLSISRSIVTAHGGRIEAMNNPGAGATFRITLPVQQGGLP